MILVKNRKALFNYELVEKYMAGIELFGHEVKALREGKCHLEGSYISLVEGNLFVVGMKIDRYSKFGGNYNEEMRDRRRRLLLTRAEITKITREISEKGKTAVPLAVLLQKNLVKMELAVVRGRKEFEKKVVEKEKQLKRETEQNFKSLKRSAF
jgi:SsrA-binding protein